MAEFNINGFSFDLSKLKKLSKEELEQQNNANLLSLFNVINTNGDNIIDNEEISIFANKFKNADKDNDNTVDTSEFNGFLKNLKKTVNFELNFDIESVMSLFNLSLNKAEETDLSVILSEYLPQEKSDDEVKEETIAYIENEFRNGSETLENFDEGIIEKGYNAIKEFLRSKMTRSSIAKALYVKNENAKLLRMAKEGKLTRREFFQNLRETMFEIFPNKDKLSTEQQEQIKQHIMALDEKQLIKYQHKILSLPNPDSEYYQDGLRNFLDSFKSETTTTSTKTVEVVQDNTSSKHYDRTEKINEECPDASSDELMTFEDVFYIQYRTEYIKEKMEILTERKNEYLLEKQKLERRNQLHAMLDNVIALNKGNSANGTSSELTHSNKQLESALINVLHTLGANSDEEMTALLQQLTGNNSIEVSQNSIQKASNNNFSTLLSPYELTNLAETLLSNIDSNCSEANTSMKEQAFLNSYYDTFGEDTADALVEAYMNDQQGAVKKLRTNVEIAGAAAMIIGLFTCPPLAIGGAAVSSAGGVGIEMLNEGTKKHANRETIESLCKELTANIALFAAGMGAGRAGLAAKSALIAKKCPRLVACIADIGVDSTLSLLADLALIGQLNIEGEGISQIVAIIAGHIKGGRIKLHYSKQEVVPGKNPAFNKALQDLEQTNPKLYEDYNFLRSKNLLPESHALHNPKNSKFTKEFLNDIEIMASAVRKGIDPIDAFVPRMKSIDDGIKTRKEGEVFSLEGTNDVYIKTADGATKLDMDRDMYYNLFPPLKSYATRQGSMGNCYFVSGFIDASMSNPRARAELLKHFHQDGNDIIFDIGHYNHALDDIRTNFTDMTVYDSLPTEIRFKNAKKRGSHISNRGIFGADGLKIVEQALGYKMWVQRLTYEMIKKNYPKEDMKRYIEELNKLFSDDSYKPSKEFRQLLVNAYQMPKVLMEETPSELRARLMTMIDDVEAVRMRQQGRGGLAKHILTSFYDLDSSALKEFGSLEELTATNLINNPNCLMLTSTKGDAAGFFEQLKMMVNPKQREQSSFDFVNGHQFRIASIDVNNKTIDVVNPWDCSKTVTIDFATYTKYFIDAKSKIQVIDITKTVANNRNSYMLQQLEAQGMPLKTTKGRYYSTEELIGKYLEKTGHLDDSYIGRNYWNVDDVLDSYKNILDNPKVKNVADKIDTINGTNSKSKFPAYLSALCGLNETAQLTRTIDALSNLTKNVNTLGKDLFNHVINLKKSPEDYIFTLEHAVEITTKMKQHNYNDSDIEYVLQVLSKDNYNSLKYLFE